MLRSIRERRSVPFGCAVLWGVWLICLASTGAPLIGATTGQSRGLPFIRTYQLDDIGSVPRGLRLGFDEFGRVAVMYDGIYKVLNDSAWVDRINQDSRSNVQMTVIKVCRDRYFYGGRGTWGLAEKAPDGTFRAVPLVPADAPAWTLVTPFNKLLSSGRGMYFYELNGVVFWDFTTRRNTFFEIPRISAVFASGDRVFVSSQDHLVRELLPDTNTQRVLDIPELAGASVEFAVQLDDTHALLALYDGRLVSFDGDRTVPWQPPGEPRLEGKITAMERLVDGGVAIAFDDQGIVLLSPAGLPRWTLFTPELRRTRAMASGEPGVLWVAGENAVHRIFYDSPLTSFGQHSGLKAAWPNLAAWNDQIVVCSNRAVYAADSGASARPAPFRVLAGGPTEQINYVVADGPHLLAGTNDGVWSLDADGSRQPLIRIENVAGLGFLTPDTCVVIGSREIAALHYAAGRWTELTPRIAGVGDSPIHLELHRNLWIEMGGDQVARLTIRDGKIDLRRIALPWKNSRWTNVGLIGNTTVLSGANGQRTYYDEARDTLCAAPELDRLLGRSPYWLLRMKQDEAGVVWATHAQGVVTFTPNGSDFAMDPETFELRNDSYPTVTILPGNNIWIGAGFSLYHVEQNAPRPLKRPHPVLVSLVADRHNRELLNQPGLPESPPRFSSDDNSLTFRFFSGTYAWRGPPLYEYRLGPGEPWTPIDPSLVLRFPKLRDGAYRLEMRQAGPRAADTTPLAFAFVIDPPWFRTPASYAGYAVLVLLSVLGIARWINHRSLRRNIALERLVHERTQELEVTMDRLAEETRNAATLAERSRLAGEIHDSLQQGLSGAILHLDTTLTDPAVPKTVGAQLNVVRNMLSYSREEVQQAVWNLESPLLQNSTLGEALRTLAGYIKSGTIGIDVQTDPEPVSLETPVQHNLLRIAQEAMTNAVKHAHANRITVTLHSHADRVRLTIADDGRGFDPDACASIAGHFGLRGLRSRAKSIRAELEIVSAPGAGTTIQVSVPLKQSLSHDLPRENQRT